MVLSSGAETFFCSLRQMAAIVLRRCFDTAWKAAAPPSHASFKQIVLQSLSSEQNDQVTSAASLLTSKV
jgi:hypothetical protein